MSLQNFVIGAIALVALGLGIRHLDVPADQSLGSASSPSIVSGCASENGVSRCMTRNAIKTATTTVCAIKSPAATSTLAYGGITFSTASTTAITVVAAKSATAYATTTAFNSASITGQGALSAASTTLNATAVSDRIFAPNTYLVFSETGGISAGDSGTGFVPSGYCSATFTVI